MRRRTAAVWLSSTIVFTCLTVTSIPLAAQETPDEAGAPRPALWSGSAATSAIHLDVNTEPTLLPVAEFIVLDVPYGSSEWDSGGAGSARAASIWPGTAVTEGPALLCDFGGGCPFPIPGYPLAAQASTTRPEASTQDGAAQATVGPDGVATRAGLSTALAPVLEPLAGVFAVDAIDSTTDLRFVDGALVSEAVSVLHGVSLLDGTIRIESLRVTATSRSDGAGTVTSTADTVVSGVTVGGQPATLSEDGITIAGQGGGAEGIDGLNEGLAAALEQFGADVRLVGADETVEQTTTTATAGGVIVSFAVPVAGPSLPTVPVPGAPLSVDPNVVYRTYVGSVVLGSARTQSFASTSGFGFGGGADLGDLSDLAGPAQTSTNSGAGGSGTTSGSFGSSPAVGTGAFTAPTSGTDDPVPTVAGPSSSTTEPVQQTTRTATLAGFSEAVADGLTLVYLFGALSSAAMFLATRLHRTRRPLPI